MPITTWLRTKFMLESWSMKINNDIIIKLTLVYWLLLIVAQVFFRPFTTSRFVDNPSGGAFRVTSIEWEKRKKTLAALIMMSIYIIT